MYPDGLLDQACGTLPPPGPQPAYPRCPPSAHPGNVAHALKLDPFSGKPGDRCGVAAGFDGEFCVAVQDPVAGVFDDDGNELAAGLGRA